MAKVRARSIRLQPNVCPPLVLVVAATTRRIEVLASSSSSSSSSALLARRMCQIVTLSFLLLLLILLLLLLLHNRPVRPFQYSGDLDLGDELALGLEHLHERAEVRLDMSGQVRHTCTWQHHGVRVRTGA